MTTTTTTTPDTHPPEHCACGCEETTARRVRLLPRALVGTARALNWAETSICPLRELVPVLAGHECDVPDYLTRADEDEARSSPW